MIYFTKLWIVAAKQVMNEKEKIAMQLYFQYDTPREDYEDIVLDSYYEKIYDMIAANSTKNDVFNEVHALMCDAEMVGFIHGYVYAIERLKETLLIV